MATSDPLVGRRTRPTPPRLETAVRGATLGLAFAAGLSLAACSGETPTPSTPTSPSQQTEQWKPAQPITHESMSEDEALELREASLARSAKANDIKDPPEIALVRWTSMSDLGETHAECLRAAGFNAIGAGAAVWYPDGIPAAQESAFNLAQFECDSKYTLHPKFRQPFSEAQLGLWYDYNLEWLVPCLEGLGVETTAPPTRQTFIAQALQGEMTWAPFSEADALFTNSFEKSRELRQTCPEYPPTEYMWG